MIQRSEDSIDVALGAIWDRVHQRVGLKCVVDYSAYNSDDNDIPIDNLDQIPIPGKVRFRAKADPFYGGKKARDYESPVLESPTWLDICVHANDMIRTTRDRHHCFLELVEVVGREGDVQIAEFFMGS